MYTCICVEICDGKLRAKFPHSLHLWACMSLLSLIINLQVADRIGSTNWAKAYYKKEASWSQVTCNVCGHSWDPGVPTTWMKDNWILCNFTGNSPSVRTLKSKFKSLRIWAKMGSWVRGGLMTVPKKQTNQKVTDQMLGTQESGVRIFLSGKSKIKKMNEKQNKWFFGNYESH